MDKIAEALDSWKSDLCGHLPAGGLYARNKVAHKWKAPLRSITLRECVFWRTHDLLQQAHQLFTASHILGSRILIRSAIETLALLIHLNQLTEKVVTDELDYHEFCEKTQKLLLGSRDGSTKLESINIITILRHCEKRYPGIEDVYGTLSESAHPNWEGVCYGYSTVDHENLESHFSNKWADMWSDKHEHLMLLVMGTFEREYNDTWGAQFEKLEHWIEAHDAQLEATKPDS